MKWYSQSQSAKCSNRRQPKKKENKNKNSPKSKAGVSQGLVENGGPKVTISYKILIGQVLSVEGTLAALCEFAASALELKEVALKAASTVVKTSMYSMYCKPISYVAIMEMQQFDFELKSLRQGLKMPMAFLMGNSAIMGDNSFRTPKAVQHAGPYKINIFVHVFLWFKGGLWFHRPNFRHIDLQNQRAQPFKAGCFKSLKIGSTKLKLRGIENSQQRFSYWITAMNSESMKLRHCVEWALKISRVSFVQALTCWMIWMLAHGSYKIITVLALWWGSPCFGRLSIRKYCVTSVLLQECLYSRCAMVHRNPFGSSMHLWLIYGSYLDLTCEYLWNPMCAQYCAVRSLLSGEVLFPAFLAAPERFLIICRFRWFLVKHLPKISL